MGCSYRSFFSFLILILFLSGMVDAQKPFRIPVDTLGKEDSVEKWAFWNKDFPKERIPDSLPSGGRLLELPIDTGDLGYFEPSGIGWFTKRVYVPDSQVGSWFSFRVGQWGAGELYVDGVCIDSIGKVAKSSEEEVRRITRMGDLPRYIFRKRGDHWIGIRFSDQSWKKESEQYPQFRDYGVTSIDMGPIQEEERTMSLRGYTYLFGVGGVLFALGLVHLLIFSFYPRKKGDLYYVFFAWALAFMLVCYPIAMIYYPHPDLRYFGADFLFYALYVFIFSLLTVLYAFLRKKGFGLVYWIILGGGILFIALCEQGFGRQYTVFLFPVVLIECARVIIASISRKDRGSWILGAGGGVFIFFPVLLGILGLIFHGGLNFSDIVGVTMITAWILVFPLSMSIYLAYDFAATGKGLERKLVEVQELNEKNLEQEREKQRILADKKEELEGKVEERTAELKERKEEIEHAHREITDSINYAQRIQEAVLPEEERYNSLPEHFIFFRPRDPVSGDFHWGKQEGGHFYLAAVDCTGHGVPGGFMSMLGVSFLNEIMANEKDLMPGEILSRLKEKVVNELSGTEGVQAKDGMDAAMVRIPIPNIKTQSPKKEEVDVEFAGAQNPLYLIRKGIVEDPPELAVYRGGEKVDEAVSKPFRDSSDGLEIQADKAGIGSEEHGVEHFRTIRFKARTGDALYIFSDGYADQFGGPKGKKFRYGAFKRLFTQLQDLSMEEQKRELEKQFDEWKGEREQVDDVLVMGSRI